MGTQKKKGEERGRKSKTCDSVVKEKREENRDPLTHYLSGCKEKQGKTRKNLRMCLSTGWGRRHVVGGVTFPVPFIMARDVMHDLEPHESAWRKQQLNQEKLVRQYIQPCIT